MNRLKIAQLAGINAPPAVLIIQQPRGDIYGFGRNPRRTPAALKAWAARNGYKLAGTRQR